MRAVMSLENAKSAVKRAKRCVVFTGAGMAHDSGIATFRNGGIWNGFFGNLALLYGGTPFGWNMTPGWVWSYFIKSFYCPIAAAAPHAGYYALNRLNQEKFGNANFHYITMNVDGYHQIAGADESSVSEIHGTIKRYHCIKCLEAINVPSPESTASCPPRCGKCGGYPRPSCVLFTEQLPSDQWNKAADVVDSLAKEDVMIIVGTSSVVYPAASLPSYAKGRGAVLIEVNPDVETPLKNLVDIHLQGTALDVLPQLVKAVLDK